MMPKNRSIRLTLRIVTATLAIFLLFGNFFSPVVRASGNTSDLDRLPAGSQDNISYHLPAQNKTPWLTVYFTSPPVKEPDLGVAKYVIDDINKAKKTVDATSDDFNLQPVVKALMDAADRGVKVRVVYDGSSGNCVSKQKDGTTFNAVIAMRAGKKIQLKDGGRLPPPSSDNDLICAKKDQQKKDAIDAAKEKNHITSSILGIMHDKIVIVDGKVLFTGSWNISDNDTYNNNNNLLRITNPTLIANYQTVFNEIFTDTDTKRDVGAKKPELTIAGVRVSNYFSPSPQDQVMDKLIALVNGAQQSIRFMAFTFTDDDLFKAMIAKANENKNAVVQGVFETRQSVNSVAFITLSCAKVKGTINVKLDGNNGTMHHKVIIIDDKIVITGSFNYTANANKNNDENVLVIYDEAIAKQYSSEFNKVFGNLNAKTLQNLQALPAAQSNKYICPKP